MRLVIGTILYQEFTAKYLPFFIHSLERQIFQDFKLVVADNSDEEDNENSSYIENDSYLDLDYFWNGVNLGFACAYNKIIHKAKKYKADYFLVINPDVKLEVNTIEKMIKALDGDSCLGSVSPKILKWNFQDKECKNEKIDSCGIKLLPGLRFVDVAQGEEDSEQFNNIDILGPSGACGMYRMDALEKIKENNQYFDELMFMYKEDCDLAYRLYLSGYKSKCISKAIAYHDRTVGGKGEGYLEILKNRKNKSKQVRIWSMTNQQIIYWKYWCVISTKEKVALIWSQIKFLINMILFEQYLFLYLIKMRKKCNLAKVYKT